MSDRLAPPTGRDISRLLECRWSAVADFCGCTRRPVAFLAEGRGAERTFEVSWTAGAPPWVPPRFRLVLPGRAPLANPIIAASRGHLRLVVACALAMAEVDDRRALQSFFRVPAEFDRSNSVDLLDIGDLTLEGSALTATRRSAR